MDKKNSRNEEYPSEAKSRTAEMNPSNRETADFQPESLAIVTRLDKKSREEKAGSFLLG
jgi:hypothetical protein